MILTRIRHKADRVISSKDLPHRAPKAAWSSHISGYVSCFAPEDHCLDESQDLGDLQGPRSSRLGSLLPSHVVEWNIYHSVMSLIWSSCGLGGLSKVRSAPSRLPSAPSCFPHAVSQPEAAGRSADATFTWLKVVGVGPSDVTFM